MGLWAGYGMTAYISDPVTGVSSKLNSATGIPLDASMGAKPAAGYTTEDVPTYMISPSMCFKMNHEGYFGYIVVSFALSVKTLCESLVCSFGG